MTFMSYVSAPYSSSRAARRAFRSASLSGPASARRLDEAGRSVRQVPVPRPLLLPRPRDTPGSTRSLGTRIVADRSPGPIATGRVRGCRMRVAAGSHPTRWLPALPTGYPPESLVAGDRHSRVVRRRAAWQADTRDDRHAVLGRYGRLCPLYWVFCVALALQREAARLPFALEPPDHPWAHANVAHPVNTIATVAMRLMVDLPVGSSLGVGSVRRP